MDRTDKAAFRPADLKSGPRAERFLHYRREAPCTFNLTTRMDVTALRRTGEKLYPALLFLLSAAVNRHESFRWSVRDGEAGIFDWMSPCYTVFHPESGDFSCLWTPYDASYAAFRAMYDETKRRFGDCPAFEPMEGMPDNLFNVSMVPWIEMDGFQLNLRDDFEYLTPIFTLGRCVEREGRVELSLSVRAHHAVCDGYRLGLFLTDLQESLDRWK